MGTDEKELLKAVIEIIGLRGNSTVNQLHYEALAGAVKEIYQAVRIAEIPKSKFIVLDGGNKK